MPAEIFCQLFGKSVAEDIPAIRDQWVAAVVCRFKYIVPKRDREESQCLRRCKKKPLRGTGEVYNFFIIEKKKKKEYPKPLLVSSLPSVFT